MASEKFPYAIWPGVVALAVIVASGLMLTTVAHQQRDPATRPLAQQTDAASIESRMQAIRSGREG
jgi:hypothetical protein